jgi:orotate phosphoribosyltransferase
VNPAEVMDVLERHGAVLHGHFRLSSGRHSDLFVQKFRAFEHPRLTQSLGEAISNRFDGQFDVVASPAIGAVVLGFATALAADVRAIFSERVGGRMVFRRGFTVALGERVLIVEDVVTTGGSVAELVELVRAAQGKVVGIGALIDRTDAESPPALGVSLRALARIEAPAWLPEQCPLCAEDEPLDDPGGRRLAD